MFGSLPQAQFRKQHDLDWELWGYRSRNDEEKDEEETEPQAGQLLELVLASMSAMVVSGMLSLM